MTGNLTCNDCIPYIEQYNISKGSENQLWLVTLPVMVVSYTENNII
jgi:hypothetical protein